MTTFLLAGIFIVLLYATGLLLPLSLWVILLVGIGIALLVFFATLPYWIVPLALFLGYRRIKKGTTPLMETSPSAASATTAP